MIQEAHNAYNAKDFKSSFKLYKALADSGDADAQTSLAYMYQNGQATEVDEAKALSLYQEAAKKEQPYAMFNLAILYANGIGGAEFDQFKAHDLFMKAAVKEVPPAMYETALMLERGIGCIQNYSEAAFWYEEAAKRGHIESFNNLGVLYKEGHGVEQDLQRSFICFERASNANLSTAHYNLGLMYDQGLGVQEDHDKALDLCRKAAYGGHEKAKAIIASLQEDGKIVF
jgi:TPR repeat protein